MMGISKWISTSLAWMLLMLGCFQSTRAEDRCADQGNGQFSCTQDVPSFREYLDGRSRDLGVDQRVDGSEDEKRQITNVLMQMVDYFNDEVFAMPEYEHVRYQW